MPQGRHRPKTYTLPLVETWEAMRVRYTKPAWWAWLREWREKVQRKRQT